MSENSENVEILKFPDRREEVSAEAEREIQEQAAAAKIVREKTNECLGENLVHFGQTAEGGVSVFRFPDSEVDLIALTDGTDPFIKIFAERDGRLYVTTTDLPGPKTIEDDEIASEWLIGVLKEVKEGDWVKLDSADSWAAAQAIDRALS